MSFPRYPKYKASGVEWLGEVPDHWVMTRLRFVTVCLDGGRVPLNSAQRSDRQGDVPYWGANSIMDYVNDALFDEPLVLLGEDGAPFFDRTKAVAFASEGRVWPNNHVHVLRPTLPTSRKFIVRVLNITDYAQFIDGSTRDKLTQGEMNNIPLPWPPLPEQITIAAFLDHETAKIDELVSEQERLIELLKEKRQAVISHAVTKGLNPDAPMKDSGIEWLGEVPEHWEVARLKNVLTQKITDGPHTTPTFHSDGVPFLSVDGIQDGELQFDGCRFVSHEDHAEFRKKAFPRKGDLLMGKAASTGKLARVKVEFEFSIWSPLALIRLTTAMANPAFFEQWLKSPIAQAQIDNLCTSNTQKNISMDDIPRLLVTIPPLEEQTAIAAFLDHETAKFTTLTTEANRVIDLLKERRTALISAAVTGQIDVRNLVPVESA